MAKHRVLANLLSQGLSVTMEQCISWMCINGLTEEISEGFRIYYWKHMTDFLATYIEQTSVKPQFLRME